MSDGSPNIRFIDPSAFKITRTIRVHIGDRALININELEWIDGEIWANDWTRGGRILRIDPSDGTVRSVVNVIDGNGIAFDAAKKRVFVTGKNWPELLQIEPCK